MTVEPWTALRPGLEALAQAQRYRVRRVLDSPQGTHVNVDGQMLLAFCSNDYLGLASDPRIIDALKRGADRYGVGSGASHLITGHMRPHHALEAELADFVGAERALLFSTGFMANLGVVTTLVGRHDVIAEDRLNHASLIDAARLAQAKVRRYTHADAAAAAALFSETKPPRLITTDAVFSMDGDLAPLPALSALAVRHQAWLLVDDAHGLGVLGAQGRGSLDHVGLTPRAPHILMGTLGKSFGGFGAFVAGDADLIETLIQQARTYIYTTALPPAVAEALRVSLAIVRREDGRRERLRALIARFRLGAQTLELNLLPSTTPIQPLLVGTAAAAVQLSEALRVAGVLVPAIRPPTVPEGACRLRVSLSAAHTEADVDQLLVALEQARRGVP
jgi:8-amino-7-oxononanoate synthase